MPLPTTGIYFSESFPAAPPGDQVCQPQSNGATPEQSVTFVPQQATIALRGTVKPDGTSITIDPDGTIHSVVTGGTGGGGTGGTSASGGAEVVVVPSGAKDGSNTQYTLPAPVLAGNAPEYVRNGVVQRQLGAEAEFAVQGTQLTVLHPLLSSDWHEFYYVQGQPNSQSGGGGTVPLGSPTFLQGNNNYGTGTTLSSTFPANNLAGSCLIVDVMFQENFSGAGSLSISDSAGNTWILAGTTHEACGIALIATWYALNCAGGPNTVTVSYSSSTTHPGMAIAIHEYAAVATASAFDTDAYGEANDTSTTPIPLSLTTTVAGDLLHLSTSCRNGSNPLGNSGGWTARETNNAGSLSIVTFDALAGAAGSYSNGVTLLSGNTGICIQGYLLALKSA